MFIKITHAVNSLSIHIFGQWGRSRNPVNPWELFTRPTHHSSVEMISPELFFDHYPIHFYPHRSPHHLTQSLEMLPKRPSDWCANRGCWPKSQRRCAQSFKRHKETEHKAAKRKSDGTKLLELHVPIVYEPAKYLLYDAPPNTVGYSIVKYLRSLQQNDTVPWPTNWASVLLDSSVRKKKRNFLSNRNSDEEPILQHVWHHLSANHYSIASTSIEFQNQLDLGLHPLVSSELGIAVSSQSTWSEEFLETLLDEILEDKSAPIEVQDHSISTLDHFTITKTSEAVRTRFDLSLKI